VAAALAHVTDHATDRIAQAARDAVVAGGSAAPTIYAAPWSRFVVDVERFADPAREVMAARGMAAVYTRGPFGEPWRDEADPGHADHTTELIERYYTPYHAGLTSLVDSALDRYGRCLIVDVHSYPTAALPYELPHSSRPPICLGTDPDHTTAQLVSTATAAFTAAGYEVGLDSPFAGALVPSAHYQSDPRVQSVMVEIRRDQYLATEPGGEPDPSRINPLADAIAALVHEWLSWE
jgi:N-formylglutamate deformylase